MDYLNGLILVFLEMCFVFAALVMLYNQRRVIGQTPFCMAMGLIYLFMHLLSAADGRITLAPGVDVPIAAIALYFPFLASLLLVYIVDGTLAAQRIIIGAAVLFGVYLYLGEVTRIECVWKGFTINTGLTAPTLEYLVAESRTSMNLMAAGHLLDFFVVPILYTRLAAWSSRRFFNILGAFLGSAAANAALHFLFLRWCGVPDTVFTSNLAARLVALVILSVFLGLYLSTLEKRVENSGRSPFDLLFAFFGSYGRSRELEENLREWTNRHRIVLENTDEVILLLTPEGRVADANAAAARLFGERHPERLNGKKLDLLLTVESGDALPGGEKLSRHLHCRCRVGQGSEDTVARRLDCSISAVELRGREYRFFIGRDVTEEVRLAAEKTRLDEQLAHAQRIESLGMLAGGVAHDFNNYLHAILGHIDVITLLHPPEDPEVIRHLEKVGSITEQAAKLTSQLLGFARKGKYQVRELDLAEMLKNSLTLMGPQKQNDVEVTWHCAPGLPRVSGDQVQLQQVMLNLLLNAVDAMAESPGEKKLVIETGYAKDAPLRAEPPAQWQYGRSEDCVYFAVTDNGSGMNEETARRLFEPFYTTKPVGKGTGMGLAMVYGTVTNHHGWIQFRSREGEGTTFCVFLPAFSTAEKEK